MSGATRAQSAGRTVGQSEQTQGEAHPRGSARGSARGNRGEGQPPWLPRCPERDSTHGVPSPPVCSGDTKKPEPGARASSPRPAAPTGAVLTDWDMDLTLSFWDLEKGALVL